MSLGPPNNYFWNLSVAVAEAEAASVLVAVTVAEAVEEKVAVAETIVIIKQMKHKFVLIVSFRDLFLRYQNMIDVEWIRRFSWNYFLKNYSIP